MSDKLTRDRVCGPSGKSTKGGRQWQWDALDQLIASAMQRWRVPGLAIVLVEHDAIVLAKGYGVRDIGKPEPVDEHTLFAISSCTKAFTATALAMLHDEGKLQWSDRVTQHLPTFRLCDPYATQEATILDLLTHRTGAPSANEIWFMTGLTRDQVLQEISQKPGVSLRAQFEYNNIMYLAAGQLIPAITGISYDDFIRTRLFQPLGMQRSNTSTHSLTDAVNVASPHNRMGDTVVGVPWCNVDNVAPAGAINSSAVDMAQWLRLQVQAGQFSGRQLVSAAQSELMLTSHTLVHPRSMWRKFIPTTSFLTYGLGWFVYDHYGHVVAMHPGANPGTRAITALLPQEKLGIAILTNLNWDGNQYSNSVPEVVLNSILDDYLNLPEHDWNHIFELVLQPT